MNINPNLKSTVQSNRKLWYWSLFGYIFFVVVAPYYAIRMLFTKKYRAGIRQRFTIFTPEEKKQLKDGPTIWIHTVSFGELQAARPLLRRLKNEYDSYKLLISTVTETGQELAHTIPEVDASIYLPLDLYPLCRRVVNRIQPVCVIIFETELWPNFIRAVSDHPVPLFLVNGRLSDHSFQNYFRFRFLFAPLINRFLQILAQSEEDAQRFRSIGALSDSVQVMGNIKFDAIEVKNDPIKRDHWRSLFQIKEDEIAVLGGSTFPGEELVLARIVHTLEQERFPVRLILAPRHIDRTQTILDELRSTGYTVFLRSKIMETEPFPEKPEMFILDTLGELREVYAAADIVFMGKSLLHKGGQNPIEPAAWEKPILFGKNMQNFRDVAGLLLRAEGARMVTNEEELLEECRRLFADKQLRMEIGQRARQVILENQGALNKLMKTLIPLFDEK